MSYNSLTTIVKLVRYSNPHGIKFCLFDSRTEESSASPKFLPVLTKSHGPGNKINFHKRWRKTFLVRFCKKWIIIVIRTSDKSSIQMVEWSNFQIASESNFDLNTGLQWRLEYETSLDPSSMINCPGQHYCRCEGPLIKYATPFWTKIDPPLSC